MQRALVCVFGVVVACGGDDVDVPDPPDAGGDPTNAVFEPDRLLDVQIDIAPADWAALRMQHRDFYDLLIDSCPRMHGPSAYSYFEGTVTIDGDVVDRVGVRKKGFLGSVTPARPSLKLSFDEYVNDRAYSGLRRMTLNNNLQDDSQMSTCLSYRVMRAAGVPAPRCNHARVTVNGTYLGIYSHVESVKRGFLGREFDSSEGNLYEGTIADFRPLWVDMYEAKPGNSAGRDDLAAMVQALGATDDALLDELTPLLDLDAYLSFWAGEVLVGHWDGYNGNRNNHYLYRDPTTDQFYFIPWGTDDGFGPPNPFLAYEAPASVLANNALSSRLYANRAVRDMYQVRLQELLDTVWDEAELLAEIDRVDGLIGPHVHVAQELHDARVGEIRDYVGRIRRDIEASLAADPDWESSLPSELCLAPVGEIAATFSATFGDFPADNPFNSGTGTLDVQLDGKPAEAFAAVGASVGPEGDPSNPKLGIAVFGLLEDGSVMFPLLRVDPALVEPGAVIAVDLYDAFGVLLGQAADADPDQATLFGFVRGTLRLDEADATLGGTVSGSLSIQLISSRAFE